MKANKATETMDIIMNILERLTNFSAIFLR